MSHFSDTTQPLFLKGAKGSDLKLMDTLNGGGGAARFVVEAVGVALVCLVVYKRVAEKFVTGCASVRCVYVCTQ